MRKKIKLILIILLFCFLIIALGIFVFLKLNNKHNLNSTEKDIVINYSKCVYFSTINGPELNNESCIFYSNEELEDKLNVKYIESNLDLKKNFFVYALNNNSDGYMKTMTLLKNDLLNSYEKVNSDKPIINEKIYIASKYYDKDIIMSSNDDLLNRKIYIKSLDITADVYNINKNRRLQFMYNNVVYSYDFMIFSRNVKNIDEEVDIFAESLYFK